MASPPRLLLFLATHSAMMVPGSGDTNNNGSIATLWPPPTSVVRNGTGWINVAPGELTLGCAPRSPCSEVVRRGLARYRSLILVNHTSNHRSDDAGNATSGDGVSLSATPPSTLWHRSGTWALLGVVAGVDVDNIDMTSFASDYSEEASSEFSEGSYHYLQQLANNVAVNST